MRQNFTAEWFRSIIDYEPATGVLTRRIPTKKTKAGGVVGTPSDRGVLNVGFLVNGKWESYKAHRLAWLHHYGEWPSEDIDHKDNDPSNNRIDNLRLATDSQNLGNMKKPITNKSGKKGVSWHAGGSKWQASIKLSGANKHLGLFDTIDEAHVAYCTAATAGRGEFARFE